MAVLCVFLMGGCGTASSSERSSGSEEAGQAVSSLDESQLDASIRLGTYKGIELQKTVYTISDERVQEKVQEVLDSTAEEVEEGEGICEGDLVNLDYEALVNGESVEDGSVEDYDLKIGSGAFLEGFEEGLTGCTAGEEKVLNLTFPEDYEDEELAGKPVTFTVQINEVKRPQQELTADWVTEHTNYETVKAYEESIRSQLESAAEDSAQTQLESDAWEAVHENAEFLEIPEELTEEYIEMQKASYTSGAEYYEMDYEEMLESLGMTEDDVEEDAGKMVENELISAAICRSEEITQESALYQEKLDELLQENYYGTYEEAVEDGIEEVNINRTVQYSCALAIILENAKITEVQETL